MNFDEENPANEIEENLPDLGPMNSEIDSFIKHEIMGGFLPANFNSEKEKVIINDEVLKPEKHDLTLGSEPFNSIYIQNI